MNPVSAVLLILVTYYAYEWGAEHKKRPHIVWFVIVMAISVITTVPAYYIGKRKLGKSYNAR